MPRNAESVGEKRAASAQMARTSTALMGRRSSRMRAMNVGLCRNAVRGASVLCGSGGACVGRTALVHSHKENVTRFFDQFWRW